MTIEYLAFDGKYSYVVKTKAEGGKDIATASSLPNAKDHAKRYTNKTGKEAWIFKYYGRTRKARGR